MPCSSSVGPSTDGPPLDVHKDDLFIYDFDSTQMNDIPDLNAPYVNPLFLEVPGSVLCHFLIGFLLRLLQFLFLKMGFFLLLLLLL